MSGSRALEAVLFVLLVLAAIGVSFGTMRLTTKALPDSPASAALAWAATSVVAAVSVICIALIGHSFWPKSDWIFYVPATAVLGSLFGWRMRSVWREIRQALDARRSSRPTKGD
jgi:hypothetical protein